MSWLILFGDDGDEEGDGTKESDAAVALCDLAAIRASIVVVIGIGGCRPPRHTDSAVRPCSYLTVDNITQ